VAHHNSKLNSEFERHNTECQIKKQQQLLLSKPSVLISNYSGGKQYEKQMIHKSRRQRKQEADFKVQKQMLSSQMLYWHTTDLFFDVVAVVVVADGVLRPAPPQEALQRRAGVLRELQLGVDPDAVAGVRKQPVRQELWDLQRAANPLKNLPGKSTGHCIWEFHQTCANILQSLPGQSRTWMESVGGETISSGQRW
jgi:hypothetical protein